MLALRRLPLVARVVAALVALAGFVVLVTPQPSVLRAAVMALIVLVALARGRPASGVPVLCLAAIAGCWSWIRGSRASTEFALSVLATAGLLVLAPPIAEPSRALAAVLARARDRRPDRGAGGLPAGARAAGPEPAHLRHPGQPARRTGGAARDHPRPRGVRAGGGRPTGRLRWWHRSPGCPRPGSPRWRSSAPGCRSPAFRGRQRRSGCSCWSGSVCCWSWRRGWPSLRS